LVGWTDNLDRERKEAVASCVTALHLLPRVIDREDAAFCRGAGIRALVASYFDVICSDTLRPAKT
jgi:hypothetical protein